MRWVSVNTRHGSKMRVAPDGIGKISDIFMLEIAYTVRGFFIFGVAMEKYFSKISFQFPIRSFSEYLPEYPPNRPRPLL